MIAGRVAAAIAIVMLGVRPAVAQQLVVSPFVGASFRTATSIVDLENAAGHVKVAIGSSVGWQGDGWFGVEGDVGFHPGFFSGDAGLVTSSRVVTAMATLVVHLPRRLSPAWIRPYGTIGAGALFVSIEDTGNVFTSRSSQAAFGAGGGVVFAVRSRLGVRADIRYFRSTFEDPLTGIPAIGERHLNFWRVSAGPVIRF